MKIKYSVTSNDITRALFKLLENSTAPEINERIAFLFEQSHRYLLHELKDLAINFEAYADVEKEKDSYNYYYCTPLETAILTGDANLINVFIWHIFYENNYLTNEEKQQLWVRAVGRCILLKETALVHLSSLLLIPFPFSCFEATLKWDGAATGAPLFLYPSNYTHNSKQSTLLQIAEHGLVRNEVATQLLQCAQRLIQTKEATLGRTTFQHLTNAIAHHSDFTMRWLAHQTEKAIQQLTGEIDTTDYRFLKKFILAFASISALSPDDTSQASYTCFQKEVVGHLIGAYDCERKVAEGIHKLFASSAEKDAFFKTPVVAPLIQGASFASTLSAMQGGKDGREEKDSPPKNSSSIVPLQRRASAPSLLVAHSTFPAAPVAVPVEPAAPPRSPAPSFDHQSMEESN